MKRGTLLAALLAVLLLAGSCGAPAAKRFTAPPVQPAQPQDMGLVRMLVPEVFDDSATIDRQRAVLDLVEQAIRKQRNIAMDISLASCPIGTKLPQMVAADDPPEIVARWKFGLEELDARYSFNNITFPPLRLNEAIEEYGGNLGNIPEPCWEISRIGDDIVSIPTAQPADTDCLAINRRMLDAHGWAVPQTFRELEDLLERAVAEGIEPMDAPLPAAWFGIPHNLDGDCPYLFPLENGALVSCYESPPYLNYLKTMREWRQKGFIPLDAVQAAADNTEKKDWLIRPYSGEDGEELLPPVAPEGAAPFVVQGETTGAQLESYHKPEALVTLADWALASKENYLLMQWGQEGVDYTLDDEGHAKTTRDSLRLSSLGLYYRWDVMSDQMMDLLAPADRSTIGPALAYAKANATPTDSLLGLPPACWRYARQGSQLKAACDGQKNYEEIMRTAAKLCIKGTHTMEDYQKFCQQNASLLTDYAQLARKYAAGTYDPAQDMRRPAAD